METVDSKQHILEKSTTMKKEFIFLGPPACGKGTQTTTLAEYLNFPHVDTGSLLRAEIKNQTPDGVIAKSFIDKGNLVPLDLVAKIIKNRLSQDDCRDGYILEALNRLTSLKKLTAKLTEKEM